MADENEDLKDEGVEIIGSARVNPGLDTEEVVGSAPLVDPDSGLLDDELDADKLDIPYVDEDKESL